MIEFDGVTYIIDLEALSKVIVSGSPKELTETKTKTFMNATGAVENVTKTVTNHPTGAVVNGPKYEMLRTFIEIILDFEDDLDETLGSDRAFEKTPLSFRVAFNTLKHYNILKELETE